MDVIKDTVFEHGVIYWPIAPPEASMLVVVKATYDLAPEGQPRAELAPLAEVQAPATGALFVEDDPDLSQRYPSDFSLLKPRAECFLTGSCRPLTGKAVERTAAEFTIGGVHKSIAVIGDRRWVAGVVGKEASKPLPFTEMPLTWERAFGGVGFNANPRGRGLHADEEGNIWLPNLELPKAQISATSDKPNPACASPMGPEWKSRQAMAGTYDEKWQQNEFPWLAKDFRFSYYNEAPLDQQIEGYFKGDESISLKHLHPRHPAVNTALPGLCPRVFIERTQEPTDAEVDPDAEQSSSSPQSSSVHLGPIEEVGLMLDTIVVDADTGLAHCVWRGRVALGHEELGPEGIDRLFVMHESISDRSSADVCRQRMQDKLDALAAEEEELSGEEVEEEAEEDPTATLVSPPGEIGAMVAAALALEEAKAGAEDDEPSPDDLFSKLKLDLAAAGMDVAALTEENEAAAPIDPMAPPDAEALKEAFKKMGQDMPPELEEILEELAEGLGQPPEATEESDAVVAEPDLRARVIELHRARRPLSGDFTGANLSELDLSGLDARDAILMGANLRGAKLYRAKLDGAQLSGADLLSADLRDASIRDADLTSAILEGADLKGARLSGALLAGAELIEANLVECDLSHADLTGADLSGADLKSSNCAEAIFQDAQLRGCDARKASFVDARFYGVQAQEIVFDGADLSRIRVGRGADLSGASFRTTIALGGHFRDAIMQAVNFAGAALAGADFTGADLSMTQLSGCQAKGAIFQGCTLTGATMTGLNLFEGSLREARLDGVDLSKANLYAVDFFRAQGEGVVLSGANLDRTMWEGR